MKERTRVSMKNMLLLLLMMMMTLGVVIPTAASSSNSSSHVNMTSSWQNDNGTPSSDWNSTAVNNVSSFDDDNRTTAEPTTAAPSITSFWQYQAMLRWFKYTPPVLIVLATVGNTVSVITLQNPMIHRTLDRELLRPQR